MAYFKGIFDDKIFSIHFAILIFVCTNLWVQHILRKNNRVLTDMPFTGRELGEKILQEQQITNVSIKAIKQMDHYNPIEKKFILGRIN